MEALKALIGACFVLGCIVGPAYPRLGVGLIVVFFIAAAIGAKVE